MTKKNEYIDVYYDDEFDPPSWTVRRVKELSDGSLEVVDADLLPSKRKAVEEAKKWSQRTGLKLKEVI